jgi:Skp family chaperone for outer membrane proteins
MILHGYVNYTGTALNYSGAPDYDLLRSIENGASLYYIIGYRNTDVLKDDEDFNKYYSVSYDNWFDDIVKKYTTLNAALADLQDFKIVDHTVILGERIIDEKEREANLQALMDEFADALMQKLVYETDKKVAESNPVDGVSVDIEKLVELACVKFGYAADGSDVPSEYATMFTKFEAQLVKVVQQFATDYKYEYVEDTNNLPAGVVTYVHVEDLLINGQTYESEYKYVTTSEALDEDYVHTDYTVANDLIVMVTYEHQDGRRTSFILNYNLYSVEVTLGGVVYSIPKYGFVKINH